MDDSRYTTVGWNGVFIDELRPVFDRRGYLMEVMRSDKFPFKNFGQAYITVCRPGIVKAWHKHKHQDDNMCIIKGMGLIGLWDENSDETLKIFTGEMCPKLIHIPAGIWHGFTPIDESEIVVLNLPTNTYDYDNPDEQRRNPDDEYIPFDWTARSG